MTGNQISEYVAIAVAIAACVTAFAGLSTVREMSRQRKASYQPALTLSGIYVEGARRAPGALPVLWTNNENGEKTEYQLPWPSLSLVNIGLGAAKDVLVSWDFPIEQLTRTLNDLAQQHLSTAQFSFRDEVFAIDSDSLGSCVIHWGNEKRRTIDYILPAAVHHEPVMLTLPGSYCFLVSSVLYFYARGNHKGSLEIPPLIAHTKYYDIGGTERQLVFNIQFRLGGFTPNGEWFRAYLEATNEKCLYSISSGRPS
ncbi:MAG: hypothetical protein ACYDB1_00025 [Acidiferrobacteraceae bacterium]